MLETIKRLYVRTGNPLVVSNAISKGWITQEEGNWILGISVD
jgi:hypothetical protein